MIDMDTRNKVFVQKNFKLFNSKTKIDKRHLELHFAFRRYVSEKKVYQWDRYILVLDHWGEKNIENLSINGKLKDLENRYIPGSELDKTYFQDLVTLGRFYKHHCQLIIELLDSSIPIHIDRRYEHNHSCDIYICGVHLIAGYEK